MLALSMLLASSHGALTEHGHLLALEAENLQLRAELDQQLATLNSVIVEQEQDAAVGQSKKWSAQGFNGPRRRLLAAAGSGATGKFFLDGTVHSFSDANTCLGNVGPLTVHNSASEPCKSNSPPAPPSPPPCA